MSATRPFERPSAEERVRDRLLLYVSVLRLPPREGLELVTRTLTDLFDPSGSGGDADMAAAMRCLAENARRLGFSLSADETRFHRAIPSYNRGSMPPARMREPWA